jgi:hypothetical protein
MKFANQSSIALVVVTCAWLSGSFSTQAWAAKAHKPLETYSATEEAVAPARVVAPSRLTAAAPEARAQRPTMTRALAPATTKAAPQMTTTGYDPVPSDQVNALSQRLKLVDTLIRRHGRAYDYRMHTVRDLEAVLARLEASAPATAPAPTVAAPAVPSAPAGEAAGIAAPTTAAPIETAPATLPVPTEEDEMSSDNNNARPEI